MSKIKKAGSYFKVTSDGVEVVVFSPTIAHEAQKKLLEEVKNRKGTRIPPEKKKELMEGFQKILDQL